MTSGWHLKALKCAETYIEDPIHLSMDSPTIAIKDNLHMMG